MDVFYLEVSALLKRYKTEAGSDVITRLFHEKKEGEVFLTSHLSVLEVHSVAARLLQGRVIDRRQYNSLLGTFLEDLAANKVAILPLHDTLVSEAIRSLPRYPLRTGDALHFATALSVAQGLRRDRFCFVSADDDVLRACAAHRLRCIDPKRPGALRQLQRLRSRRALP